MYPSLKEMSSILTIGTNQGGRYPGYGYASMKQSTYYTRRSNIGKCRDTIVISSTVFRSKVDEEIGLDIRRQNPRIAISLISRFLKVAKGNAFLQLTHAVSSLATSGRWFTSFSLCWRHIAGAVTLLLFFLNFGAEASDDHLTSASQTFYHCEDVSHYYTYLEGLKGKQLMEKLHNIVSPHHSLPYNQVWDALQVLDAADIDHPKDSPNVIEIYSLRAVPKTLAGKPQGWNREHLWPRSYGLGKGPEFSDLHNLHPADVNVNSSRGNKYYGMCVPSSMDCLRPANPNAAPDTATDKEIWTPPAKVRGDIARSVLYMAIRYGFNQPPGSHNLHVSNSPRMEDAQMGLLSVLLEWNEIDPPSRSEQLRNDNICKIYQHNRNPFVDHPEYATRIWENSRGEAPVPTDPEISNQAFLREKISMTAWINELHYENKGKDENEFIEVAVGTSMDLSKLKIVLYNGADGKVYRSLSLSDSARFSIADTELGFSIITVFLPAGSLQNGPADGMALVEEGNRGAQVLHFLSYEGSIEAVDGPAKGLKSFDIMVNESKDSSAIDSLGLSGKSFGYYRWTKFVNAASPGRLNKGQHFLEW